MNLIRKSFTGLLSFAYLIAFANFGVAQDSKQINSTYASHQINADGTFQIQEWNKIEQRFQLQHGWVAFLNDDSTLYIFINLTEDSAEDAPKSSAPWGDFISLSFDIDRNRKITPNVDVAYGLYPGSYRAGIQHYLEPGVWTGLQSTEAQIAAGFSGAYSRSPHRFWEVAIPLSEIQAQPGQIVRIGIHTYSESPHFNDYQPPDLTQNFSELLEVKLAQRLQNQSEQDSNIRREITSEGIVRIYYPDGRIKELYDNGFQIIYPDGTVQRVQFVQVQALIPPVPPDNHEREWLETHASNLLSVMEGMVGSASVSNYKRVESQKFPQGNLYEVIDMRLQYIDRLSSL